MARKVIVVDHFKEYGEQLERGTIRALEASAETGVAAARATRTRGYRIGGMLAQVRAVIRKGPNGWEAHIISPDWKSIFFLFGTYKHRRKKLSYDHSRRRSAGAELRGGIKPVRYLQAARRAGAERLLEELEQNLKG